MIVKQFLLALLIAAPLAPLPASAQNVYLLIKSAARYDEPALSVTTIPMSSLEACEEEGAKVATSKRYNVSSQLSAREFTVFECVSTTK